MSRKFRILVIGSGGREHAMVWSFARDPGVEKVFCVPGNGGTSLHAGNSAIPVDDFDGILRFVRDHRVDFTVVGPEIPLARGIVDRFNAEGELIFGPTRSAARLESSKIFARKFMSRNRIPQPRFIVCDSAKTARDALTAFGFPLVVKADGLAAGKGVIICRDAPDFEAALEKMFTVKAFGSAGMRITVEEFLDGEELSVFAVCDGESYIILNTAQDHKRVFDGDKGPNTGGMGAYSPTALAAPELMTEIESTIIAPTLTGLKKEGTPYRGFLYAGLMIVHGKPYVIEFNVRMGDPETQVILPLLKSSFAELIFGALHHNLHRMEADISKETAVTVVLTADGYPGSYPKGMIIEGLEDCGARQIFHAGTKRRDDTFITTGGRVLNVVGSGAGLSEAIKDAYLCIGTVRFDHMFYRRDIGRRGLQYLLRKQHD